MRRRGGGGKYCEVRALCGVVRASSMGGQYSFFFSFSLPPWYPVLGAACLASSAAPLRGDGRVG